MHLNGNYVDGGYETCRTADRLRVSRVLRLFRTHGQIPGRRGAGPAGVRLGPDGGAGLLLVGVLAFVKPRALRIPRSRLLFFAAYAVIAVAGVQSLFFAAITRLPVGVTLLIEFISPVLVVLWVRFVRRVRLPRAAFVGAVVAVIGLGIVVEAWSGLQPGPGGPAARLLRRRCAAPDTSC